MLFPIGTILPWHKSLATVSLPAGWVQCDGQTLNDGASPYNGKVIPNLNGGGRFLRGAATSGTMQDDAIQGHHHEGLAAPSWPDLEVLDNYIGAGSYVGLRASTGGQTVKVKGAVTDGANGTPRVADETRSKNMSVVWIMKVKEVAESVDADELDGLHASAFALAEHTHSYAPVSHTHSYEPQHPHEAMVDGERDVWLEDGIVKFGHWDAATTSWITDKVICGEAIIPPAMILKLDGEIIPNGSTVEFGSRTVAGSINKTFTMENPGNVPLENISIWHNGNAHFTTAVQPPSSIGPLNSGQFCLRYSSPVVEDAAGVFHLVSNDPNTPDYIINVHAETTA